VRADTELTQALSRVAGLEPLVAAWPDLAALRTAIDEVVAADEAVAATQAHARRARRAESEAQARVRELEGAQRDDLAAFDRVRDTVASLGPPAADRADLAAAWSALKAWVAERLPVARDAADAASARVEAARGQAQAIRSEAAAALAEHGLQLATGEDPARVAAAGTERSRAGLERLQRDAGRAADLRTQCHEAERSADLARALGQHLSARGFEKWVLDEALAELTVGATETLRTLSGGAYSLTLDDKSNFVVVDHRNADENRSARTLSGGETFLASLALALALADQVGSLASDGAARIESIFLDEGFGTLDADTLDVVAAAIEELGSRGRMVGLVSHVPELAERVPVRFEVRRDPAGSHVEKVVV
jgi:exonuclease SbcC